jgi:hypothetical protein
MEAAEEARLQGNALFRDERWADAEQAYRSSLAACPSSSTGSNLTATLLKLNKHEEAAASADAALGLPATPAVRAKLHYRRGLALSGAKRGGAAARAFTASAREHYMKEVGAAALRHDAAATPECDLTAVPCVRKLSDAYFDRIARVGNTSALHACRSRAAQAYNDTVFAAGKAGDSAGACVSCLFAGCGDFRNVLATMVELHSGGGVSTMTNDDLPHEVRDKALRGPPFKMSLSVTMNDLCVATLARNVTLMAIAAAGPASDAAPAEQLQWTWYLLAVWGNRTLFAVHHDRLRQLLETLVAASSDVESFRSSTFGRFVSLDGGPGEPSATLEQLRAVWRGWLLEPRSAVLTVEEQMYYEERRSSAAHMRRQAKLMGMDTELADAAGEPEQQDFFEYCGWLMLSKEASATLSQTEAGAAALAEYNTPPGADDGKIMNPTLCDHGGSGAFLDAQGPFKAFDARDNEMEEQLFGTEPWGVPPVATVHSATCPAGARPGDMFPVDIEEEYGVRQINVEVPEDVQPGETFEFEVARQKNFLDALLLRMTHMRRVFRATTTDAREDGMQTMVYIAPGDAFAVAGGYRDQSKKQFDVINLSNVADYSGLLAGLLWYVPLLRTPESVLQVQTMLGTHQTPDEWVQRQTGGSCSAQELDNLLGLESEVIRQHGAMEIEYRKVSKPLERWEQATLPMVKQKLLALFGWISDGQQMPMGAMMTGLMQGRCLGSTCTGSFVKLLHMLCTEASDAHKAAALQGVLDTLIGNGGKEVDRTSPVSRRCVALLGSVVHTLTKHGRSSLSPAIDATFAEMIDPVVTLRCIVNPFSNRIENFIEAGSKEPMLLAVLTKGKTLSGGRPIARLQGAQLVEAMKTADANVTQLVDTLIFNQFTRVLTLVVPRSLLVAPGSSDPWQVQLLDIIDWRWVTNPVLLSSTTFAAAGEVEQVSTRTRPEGPTLAEMMTACAENDDEGDGDGDGDGDGHGDGDGPRCEVCRCSAQKAMDKAAKRGDEVAQHFEGGLREQYCCECYDKLFDDIKKKKKAQAERDKAAASAAAAAQTPQASLFETAAAGEAANVKPVEGIGIWGDQFSDEKVVLDGSRDFVPVPTPQLLGVPLMAKRLSDGSNGPEQQPPASLNLIVRLMSDPRTGLAPADWQYGGAAAAPKVLLARGDGKPFTVGAWAAIDDYMVMVFDDEPSNYKRRLTKKHFGKYLHGYHMQPIEPSLHSIAYPKGLSCEIQGVQSDETLNGMVGRVFGWKANGRIKLKIETDMFEREIALKPQNLRPC